MFDHIRNTFGRRFVRHHTTSRLTDIEAMYANAEELLSGTPKSFVAKHELVEVVTKRIEGLIRLDRKLELTFFVLSLVLCSAILGVSLKVSMLGFELSDFVKLKELALVAFIGGNLASVGIFYEIGYLEGLRKLVSIKVYGEKNTKVLELLHARHEMPFLPNFDYIDSSRYSLRSILLRLPQIVGIAMSIIVIVLGYLTIQGIIAYEVWTNSRLGYPLNRILVVFYLTSILTAIYSLLVRSYVKSIYRDSEKQAIFDKLSLDDKAYTQAVRDFMKREKDSA